MGKRAQFSFMFTESTAKHIYDSVASIGFYYYCINTHTQHNTAHTNTHIRLSGSVFVFLRFQPVPFCCRLFCQWNYAYFSHSHSLSHSTTACMRFFLLRSFVRSLPQCITFAHVRTLARSLILRSNSLSLIHYVFAFCFARNAVRWAHRDASHKTAYNGIASAAVCVQIHGRIELLRSCVCAAHVLYVCVCVPFGYNSILSAVSIRIEHNRAFSYKCVDTQLKYVQASAWRRIRRRNWQSSRDKSRKRKWK